MDGLGWVGLGGHIYGGIHEIELLLRGRSRIHHHHHHHQSHRRGEELEPTSGADCRNSHGVWQKTRKGNEGQASKQVARTTL